MRTNPRPRALLTRCDATKATRAHASRSYRRCNSLEDLILKDHAFRIVFFEPGFRNVRGGEGFDVIGIADLPATLYALAFLARGL
jgi:hypothetical protein